MAQRCGSSERCCRFHFKMRIWCFCRLLLSIKLLKCFGNNNNKNPVKYISRCFYGKFPRQLLTEKKKSKLQNNPVIPKAQRSPVRLNATLHVRCVQPPQVDELGGAGGLPHTRPFCCWGVSLCTESTSASCS